jgi:hypothetical protein
MNKQTLNYLITIILVTSSILTGCNRPATENGEVTLDITQAYQTVQARLTESSLTTPSVVNTDTPTTPPNETSTPVPAQPTSTNPPTSPPTTQPPAKKCDQAAAGVPIDVTIPDDTELTPGQSFTKTWRLQNSGTCTWTSAYRISLFSGDSMSAPDEVALPSNVAPGESVDVAVDLVAPLEAGAYQGNWKLKNENGDWFGIGPSGDSAFWVKILIKQSITGTLTPSVSVTPTITTTLSPETQTPNIIVSDSANLSPNDTINLDNLLINSGNGDDISYTLEEENQKLYLSPLAGVSLGVLANSSPDYYTCQAMSLSNATLVLNYLNAGDNICFLTESSNYGYFQLISLDQNNLILTIQVTTWSNQ